MYSFHSSAGRNSFLNHYVPFCFSSV